ncbi:MAG: IS3 family transposase [Lachnospiraceae bacterium]|nr:IS3 family transposase [Lachnospiraceae bacterium]
MNDKSSVFELIQATMLQSGNTLSVARLCAIAGVSRSGYYNWLNAATVREAREKADQTDFELILQAYQFRGYDKGARGIHMRLLHLKTPVNMNVKKIRRLMQKYHLFCPIRKANPYRRMAKALKTSSYASNLLNRQFEAYGPRIVLLTDITYIPYNGVFAYLSVIMDAYTKQILAYALSDSLEVDFVLDTVNRLIEIHGISLQAETIIHSDQGCHYTSHKFIDLTRDIGLRRSMSRRGNCWDNAPQESFFGHMKDSIDLTESTEFEQVRVKIDDYIDYYNNDRYQWNLCKLSPNEYYEFVTTGIYPIKGVKTPEIPMNFKDPSVIGSEQ